MVGKDKVRVADVGSRANTAETWSLKTVSYTHLDVYKRQEDRVYEIIEGAGNEKEEQ